MFRVWGRIIKENHLIRDTVVELPGREMSRTKKVFTALEMMCNEFDLAVPIWLDSNIADFRHGADLNTKAASIRNFEK